RPGLTRRRGHRRRAPRRPGGHRHRRRLPRDGPPHRRTRPRLRPPRRRRRRRTARGPRRTRERPPRGGHPLMSPNPEPERPGRARTRLVHTRADLAPARDALPGRVAVVPAVAALHEGHRALLRKAREIADSVIATVFVNPLQFGPGEDLDRCPRTLGADLALCAEEGVDLVFAPVESELYPSGRDGLTTVHAGPGGDLLEGASRPGFFTGVLTVVAKLFHLTRPHAACFGEKDF